ncbi:MAG: insulinase family protein, partial [Gemmatimonadales bacterium]|nr:insulinase family protein [Gemmatimonadales bacterium]
NGTAHFPKQDLVAYLEGIGMRFGPEVNAYTSFDETVYMLTVPTDSAGLLETGFQVLQDWAAHQLLDHGEIDLERGVVLEEWRLGRGAQARMQDRQLPVIFQGSRYAERLPIGTRESLETFTYEAVERFYHDWYRPDLVAVVAVGDFEPAAVEGFVREYFSSIPPATSPRSRPVFDVPDHEETLFGIATDPEATQTQVSVYFKQPRRPHDTHAAFRQWFVEALYNQMLNQRLFELTQKSDAPFLAAFSGQGSFVRSKEVYALGALVREGGVVLGLEAVLTEAERVAQHGFTASELERTKREFLRGMEQAFAEREKSNSASYAGEYVQHYLTGEPTPGILYEYRLAQEYVPTIQLEEVNRIAREWIVDRDRVVVVSAPEKADVPVPDEATLAAAFATVGSQTVTAYDDVVTDVPLVTVDLPLAPIVREDTVSALGLTVWRLANGVRVMLKPTDFKDDQVLFRAWSPGGTSLASDEGYLPAATATSAVTVGGAGQFSLIDLQKVLADKAVSVSPYISSLYEGLTGSASPRDVETLFQLIYLYVTAPRSDPEAFEAYRSRIAAFLENRSRSPESAFQDTLQVTLAQHHPRAMPLTPDRIAQMDLDASFAFYRDRFADVGDFTFVFVGSFEVATLRPLVQRYLGALPASGRIETWRDDGIEPPAGVVRRTVERGVEPKSETVIVFTGAIDDTRENRYALQALEEVLRIRLRERLREDLGGTYGADVSSGASRFPDREYTLRISFGSDPGRVEELTGVVFEEIESLQQLGPTAEELEKVREIQRRDRETSLRENGFWLGQLVLYDQLGLDPRDLLSFDGLIRNVSVEQIRTAAIRYLRQDNYVLVSLFPERTN